MASENLKELKSLQISNNTSLAAAALIHDLGHEDDTASTLTSYSSSTSSIPAAPQKFELHIGKWAKFAETPVNNAAEGAQKVCDILNYFISVASANGYQNTPAVQTLHSATQTAQNGLDPTLTTVIPWKEKISHNTRTQTPSYTLRLKEYVLNGVPLFNIFDAISILYTACLEDLFTVRECELHLYQFRLMLTAFNKNIWINGAFVPNTVAATWYEAEEGQPFIIGFATTCIGKAPQIRGQMNKARKLFCEGAFEYVKESHGELCAVDTCPNLAGNCPEYLAWEMICRNQGKYSSLCLSVLHERSFKYCGHCEGMANFGAVQKNKQIEDLWNKSSLVSMVPYEVGPYPAFELKSMNTILADKRGRRVGKKS